MEARVLENEDRPVRCIVDRLIQSVPMKPTGWPVALAMAGTTTSSE
jgi:hypothetical protein